MGCLITEERSALSLTDLSVTWVAMAAWSKYVLGARQLCDCVSFVSFYQVKRDIDPPKVRLGT